MHFSTGGKVHIDGSSKFTHDKLIFSYKVKPNVQNAGEIKSATFYLNPPTGESY